MGIHKLSSVSAAAVILLFLAACAYMGAGIYGKLSFEEYKEPLRSVNAENSPKLNGIAIRREQLVCSPSAEINDGSRLPKGSVVCADYQGDPIISEDSALFYSDFDGFEYLGPEEITGLSPSGFKELLKSEPQPISHCSGRLVYGWDWYFAAACPENPELRLYSLCELFFEEAGRSAEGRTVYLSSPENGEILVLIRLNSGGDDFLRLRKTRASLKFY